MDQQPNLIIDESELVDFSPTPVAFTGQCTCGWACGHRERHGKTSDSFVLASTQEEAAAKIRRYHDVATKCAAPNIVVWILS